MDDMISRQAAIDALYNADFQIYDGDWAVGRRNYMTKEEACAIIDGLPSAQRKGKWIATKEWGGRNYSCSCCNFSFMVDTCMYEPMWNFCPNCGAWTKGEEDEVN